jgi:CheY-like chemotaxis protein
METTNSEEHSIVVMVADDELPVRQLIDTVLRQDSVCRVLVACDGVEALGISREYAGKIDLLITDIDMPRMNGLELARQIIADRPGIRLLLISGVGAPEDSAGLPFIAKPFNIGELKAKVNTVLNTPPPAPAPAQ